MGALPLYALDLALSLMDNYMVLYMPYILLWITIGLPLLVLVPRLLGQLWTAFMVCSIGPWFPWIISLYG